MKFIRKSVFFIFTVLISSNISISAPLLLQASDKKTNIETIDRNLSVIKDNFNFKNDSIKTLTYKTLKLSELVNYQSGIENSCFYLGRFFYLNNHIDSAMYFYKMGLEKAKNNKSNLINSFYIGVANIFWDTGDYSGGLETMFEAKQYFESEGIIDQKYEIFNYTGLYYEGIMEFGPALENFKKSTEIAINRGENGYTGVVYANMGRVYSKLMKYDTSIIFFKKGVALEVKNKLFRNAGRSYSSLATVYLNLNQIDSARIYLEEALNCNLLSNDSTGLVRTYIAYANYYIRQSDFKKSIEILTNAIPIATKFKNKSEMVELFYLMAQSYYKTGNYKESSRFYIEYIGMYQQVYDIKKFNQVSALEHQLKITQQENEINILKIEKQQSVTNYLLIIAVLLLTISVSSIAFVIYFRKMNQQLINQNKKISEQKENLEELNKQLILAEKNMSKIDELKSNFINILSHEIRTPLNSIVGFSSLAFDSEISNEEKIEASNIIKKSSDDLISTVEGLVDLSLINSNQMYVYKENFDVYSFMKKIHDDFINLKNNFLKDNIAIHYLPDKNYSGFIIKSDSVLLKKSLNKLMHNALKFTLKGKIEYGFSISDSRFTFFVTDTGIGIPGESNDKIYIPFEKGDNVPKNSGGLGISLALVKKYIGLLEGKIGHESVLNKGSKFYFEIPIQ
ncbi:MAG: hypothetical protein A2X13_04155 [Bacteroidetes bacterium GWC2_33_15]|nr:MAG: hypothetical protein A2X10_00920 [Bacteroidetes bacterium GWA2_33_15]OFX49713.1 MAG: hypothetical protein A2X13_04155 [Bacteroidetes bacterium GWC2_33_15]OFX65897.1 MAG: hypothetical protein A2X15_10680 [Bacteroidetes bacterium GWB2_32_14]OFX68342.1 MAG: hypothetical protein A2X14_08215 [Bacteroidetes bacterium GWD2_33_33]